MRYGRGTKRTSLLITRQLPQRRYAACPPGLGPRGSREVGRTGHACAQSRLRFAHRSIAQARRQSLNVIRNARAPTRALAHRKPFALWHRIRQGAHEARVDHKRGTFSSWVVAANGIQGIITERVTQRSACGVPGEFERRVVGALAQRITCIYRSAASRLARREYGLDLTKEAGPDGTCLRSIAALRLNRAVTSGNAVRYMKLHPLW